MPLQLFGFHDHPNDFAVSKTATRWEDCAFMLDFSRPLRRFRQLFGRPTRRIGPTVSLLVPVAHVGETTGAGYVIGVARDEPYFTDIQKLWSKHYRAPRQMVGEKPEGLAMIAQFGIHFPEDAKPPA